MSWGYLSVDGTWTYRLGWTREDASTAGTEAGGTHIGECVPYISDYSTDESAEAWLNDATKAANAVVEIPGLLIPTAESMDLLRASFQQAVRAWFDVIAPEAADSMLVARTVQNIEPIERAIIFKPEDYGCVYGSGPANATVNRANFVRMMNDVRNLAPTAKKIVLISGVLVLAVDASYRDAIRLDGISTVSFRGVGSDGAMLQIEPGMIYGGKTAVLFSSGRTGVSDNIDIRDIILDGSKGISDMDTQQSCAFRATGVQGLVVHNVTVQNFAADGFKLAGKSSDRWCERLEFTDVQASQCGRALFVFQRLVRDVVARNIETRNMPKGAIDFEPTTDLQGPTRILIEDAELLCGSKVGGLKNRPDFGVTLGGSEKRGENGSALASDITLRRVKTDAGLRVFNARAVVLEDVEADALTLVDGYAGYQFGLFLDSEVEVDLRGTCVFKGTKYGAKLSARTTDGIPYGPVMTGTATFEGPLGAIDANHPKSIVLNRPKLRSGDIAVVVRCDAVDPRGSPIGDIGSFVLELPIVTGATTLLKLVVADRAITRIIGTKITKPASSIYVPYVLAGKVAMIDPPVVEVI